MEAISRCPGDAGLSRLSPNLRLVHGALEPSLPFDYPPKSPSIVGRAFGSRNAGSSFPIPLLLSPVKIVVANDQRRSVLKALVRVIGRINSVRQISSCPNHPAIGALAHRELGFSSVSTTNRERCREIYCLAAIFEGQRKPGRAGRCSVWVISQYATISPVGVHLHRPTCLFFIGISSSSDRPARGGLISIAYAARSKPIQLLNAL